MNKSWKLILLLVGIFLAGGVTGAFVMMRVGRAVMARRPAPDDWAPMHLKRLAERLDLQKDQLEQIRPIVRRNMEELGRVRSRAGVESKAILERMEQEVAAMLTPEQRVKFEQMNKEFRERVRKFFPERPGRPGPRPERERPPGGEEPPPAKPPAEQGA